MDVLSQLGEEVDHLLASLNSVAINGQTYTFGQFVATTYIFWMFVAILLLAIDHVPRDQARGAGSQGSPRRRGRGPHRVRPQRHLDPAAGPEGREEVLPLHRLHLRFHPHQQPRRSRAWRASRYGHDGRHRGAFHDRLRRSSTSSGARSQGTWTYIKSFSPHGVPFPINLVVWVIEVFSACLRIFTLAVRLFANMYAGHIILGIFATLTALFSEGLIEKLLRVMEWVSAPSSARCRPSGGSF